MNLINYKEYWQFREKQLLIDLQKEKNELSAMIIGIFYHAAKHQVWLIDEYQRMLAWSDMPFYKERAETIQSYFYQ